MISALDRGTLEKELAQTKNTIKRQQYILQQLLQRLETASENQNQKQRLETASEKQNQQLPAPVCNSFVTLPTSPRRFGSSALQNNFFGYDDSTNQEFGGVDVDEMNRSNGAGAGSNGAGAGHRKFSAGMPAGAMCSATDFGNQLIEYNPLVGGDFTGLGPDDSFTHGIVGVGVEGMGGMDVGSVGSMGGMGGMGGMGMGMGGMSGMGMGGSSSQLLLGDNSGFGEMPMSTHQHSYLDPDVPQTGDDQKDFAVRSKINQINQIVRALRTVHRLKETVGLQNTSGVASGNPPKNNIAKREVNPICYRTEPADTSYKPIARENWMLPTERMLPNGQEEVRELSSPEDQFYEAPPPQRTRPERLRRPSQHRQSVITAVRTRRPSSKRARPEPEPTDEEAGEPVKRHRRKKTSMQLNMLREVFLVNPKPAKMCIRVIAQNTRLTYQEVSRWFRNERHKSKKGTSRGSRKAAQRQLPGLEDANEDAWEEADEDDF